MNQIPTSLLPRLMSTITLWAMIAATVLLQSEMGYCFLIAVAALGSLWEYFWLLRVSSVPRHWHIGYVAGIALLLGNFWLLRSPRFAAPIVSDGGAIFAFDAAILAITVMILFFREFITAEPKRTVAEGISFTLFGVIYIPWLFSFVAKLLYLTPHDATGHLTGPYYVIFLFGRNKIHRRWRLCLRQPFWSSSFFSEYQS